MLSDGARGLRALLALCLLAALTPISAARAASDQEVTIDGGTAPLHGSLLLADHPGPATVVLLIPGSGPVDRDGNSIKGGLTPNTLKLLAQDLAQGGISSLRFDKRGVGASASALHAESDIKLGTEVSDVVGWARFLRTRIPNHCIALLGMSEGALLASMAAQKIDTCGLVLVGGAGRPAGELLKAQLTARPMPAALRKQAFDAIDTLQSGRPVNAVAPALRALFRPSVQPYMISWLHVDPTKELASVHTPVLILQGEADKQVSTEDAQLLAKSNPASRLVLLPDVNHALKDVRPAGGVAPTTPTPEQPLDTRAVASIIDFLRTAARPH